MAGIELQRILERPKCEATVQTAVTKATSQDNELGSLVMVVWFGARILKQDELEFKTEMPQRVTNQRFCSCAAVCCRSERIQNVQ